jgi:hypothetical protein
MIDVNDLVMMRETAADALVDSCILRRPTSTLDGAGGSTVSYTTSGVMPCLLMPAGVQAQLELVAQSVVLASPYVVRFTAGADIRVDDELTISGRTFVVRAPLAGGAMELVRRVAVVEIT